MAERLKALLQITGIKRIFGKLTSDSSKWKTEFNSERRSSTYDRIINLYALRRTERLRVLETLLPVHSSSECRILELGAGTGIMTELLAEHYPHSVIEAVEGAEKMMEQAKSKTVLQDNDGRIKWILADYSSPSWLAGVSGPFSLVVTIDALHHLTHERKRELYREIYDSMEQGGCFLVSDHITSTEPYFNDPQYVLWVQEVLENLKGIEKDSDLARLLEDQSSLSYSKLQDMSVSAFRKELTAGLKMEGENPMPLMQHIDVMRSIGFSNVTVEYRYANFAVISARKEIAS